MSELEKLSEYVPDPADRAEILAGSDLPTVYARDEMPTLEFAGIRLHSNVKPSAESELLPENVEAELRKACERASGSPLRVIVFGAGLGYIVKALDRCLKSWARQNVEIICVEAEPIIARKALQLRVWEPVTTPCRWVLTRAGRRLNLPASGESIIVRHSPGYRSARDQYEASLVAASARTNSSKLRILVPTPMYGGSYPIAHYSAKAFRELGHDVCVLDLAEFHERHSALESLTANVAHRRALQGLHVTLLAEMIVARALDFRADLVWAVAQTPLVQPALVELRAEGVKTALWFVEDYRLFDYWREVAPHYDAVFTIQRGDFFNELARVGVKHAAYLPLAADPQVHRPLQLSDAERSRFGSTVSFVGAGYPNRFSSFSVLDLPDFKIWGNDWPTDDNTACLPQEAGRRVTTDEAVRIFNATTVNLNLHSSVRSAGVDPQGDFVNPRTFELAACGAFQLVDRRSELRDLFNEGQELCVFDDVKQIPELISQFAADPDTRARFAEAARRRVLKEHTYVHRMQSALDALSNWIPELSSRKQGPNYLDSLLGASSGDAELTEFLSQFDRDRALNLDDIVAVVQKGKGKLSRPEAMFLLMKEFRDWGVERGVIA